VKRSEKRILTAHGGSAALPSQNAPSAYRRRSGGPSLKRWWKARRWPAGNCSERRLRPAGRVTTSARLYGPALSIRGVRRVTSQSTADRDLPDPVEASRGLPRGGGASPAHSARIQWLFLIDFLGIQASQARALSGRNCPCGIGVLPRVRQQPAPITWCNASPH
jgi:hypothetical protein